MENPDVEIGKDYDDEKSEILRDKIIQMLKKQYPDAVSYTHLRAHETLS